MSLLSVKHVFGIQTSIPNCIFYLDEHCYVYPSSRHIILYNIEYKSQRLINYGNEFEALECLSISPNKQYLVIGLSTLEKSRIIIYDISGRVSLPIRRRKILTLKQSTRSTHILSLVFSHNSKFLVTLYAPDYSIICWSIDKFTIVATIPLHILQTDFFNSSLNLQISFNPHDSFQLLLTGNHIYRRYSLNNAHFTIHSQAHSQRCEVMNITCHCWLNEDHVLVGLDSGILCTINKHGEIIQKYNVVRAGESTTLLHNSSNLALPDRTHSRHRFERNLIIKRTSSKIYSHSQLSLNSSSNRKTFSTIGLETFQKKSSLSAYNNITQTHAPFPSDIICLLPFSRGVLVSTCAGDVIMYERSEHNIQLTYLRRLVLPSHLYNDGILKKSENNFIDKKQLKKTVSIKFSKHKSNELILSSTSIFSPRKIIKTEFVNSLALSPNEETLLIATNFNQLYEISFSKMDYAKKESSCFTKSADNAHHGPIIAAAICIRKSILFTLGMDRYLKIWNLQTNHQELNHQFSDEPLLITIHPLGILICISFLNSVHLYGYTIQGLTLFKDFQIPNVLCVEYNHQGNMLAIAYNNILQFHHHYDYDQITFAQKNLNKFRLVRWTYDDTYLLSVDVDDLISRWDPYSGQRLFEYKIHDFLVKDILLSSDNVLAYLITHDKKLKEFQLMTSVHDINIQSDDFIPTSFAYNDQLQNLFIGTEKGSIYSLNFSQTNLSTNMIQMNVHYGSITKLLIVLEYDLIVSMGDDGHVIIYHYNSQSSQNKESKLNLYDEVLIDENLFQRQKIELENLIKHQSKRSKEYEIQNNMKENEYIEHLERFDMYCQTQINLLEMQINKFQHDKINLKHQNKNELNRMTQNNENSIIQFSERKRLNYEKLFLQNELLHLKVEKLNQNQIQQIDFLNNSYERYIELIHLEYRTKTNKITSLFNKDRLALNLRILYLQEINRGFQESTVIELNRLNEEYQRRQKYLLDNIQQLENQQVLFYLRLEQLEEELNNSEEEINKFKQNRNELLNLIRQVDLDLNLAKQAIQQRNSIIQEKLKRTNEMEGRRDELEKFAYVFTYKIRELTSQIGPRQREVDGLIEQYNNMDIEYDLLNQTNEKFSIKISDCKARIRAIEKDLYNETFSIRRLNETAANMKEDLKLCCHFIDQPKRLVEIIRKVYGKYVLYIPMNMKLASTNLFDCDRQRTFFERTNLRLQEKLSMNSKREKFEKIRRIKEQISMMREISLYCLKVVAVERILSDLDIVSNLASQMNVTTSTDIINALKFEQSSSFIENKQNELNLIISKQEKRLEQLKYSIYSLEKDITQHFVNK